MRIAPFASHADNLHLLARLDADGEPGNHVVIKDGTGVDTEAMISTDTDVPVTETGFALNIDDGTPLTDGEEYTFEFEMLDADDQPVTVTQTARWSEG